MKKILSLPTTRKRPRDDLRSGKQPKRPRLASLQVQGKNQKLARSHGELARAQEKRGEYFQAKDSILKAIDIFTQEQVYGTENHEDVAWSYSHLAFVQGKMGDPIQARVYYLKAIEMYTNVYGNGHSMVTNTRKNLIKAFLAENLLCWPWEGSVASRNEP